MLMDHWLWMTLTAWTGTAMAVVVSTLVKTERAALTAVPLLLVPQMLLAGALVPYREMNRGLFENAGLNRERGGAPEPARFMPLRYAYEAMIVSQATRNPFEVERIRLQRSIDRNIATATLGDERREERLELLKEGLRRLMAAGATSPKEAGELVTRIMETAREGRKAEVETMKIWPDDESKARPASEFFVNERIDLMVREAETFRNDYRNEEARNVFLALKKPIPFVTKERASLAPKAPVSLDRPAIGRKTSAGVERMDEDLDLETQRYSGAILVLLVIGCAIASSAILYVQNRKVT